MSLSEDARLYSELMRSDPVGFSEALSVAGLGVFIAHFEGDDEQRQLDYNSTLRRAFGLPERGTVSRADSLQRLVHPDDVDMMRRLADANIPKGEAYTFRHRILHADGRFARCVTFIKPVLNATGEPKKLIGVMRDQDELEQSIGRLDRAERLAGLGNWRIDLRTDELAWSDGTFLIYGYEPGEIQPSLEFARHHYVDQDVQRVTEIIEEAQEDGSDYEFRTRIRTKLGDQKHVRIVAEVELAANGEPVAYSGIIQDVTEETIREAQVRQSQKIEALGNMTGGAAHDFNNLLAVVLGNLELLRDEIDRPDLVEYCEAAITATMSGAALTRNMLSFARRARLEPKSVDINAIVRDLERWARRTLPATIETEVSLQAGLWKTDLDEGSLESALLNLILNARDAMPEGGKLTVETSNVRIDEEYIDSRQEDIEPGRFVLLAVSDTGTGIPAEELVRIFEPFFTTKDVGKGTGLGLSMVQGFVKQSSGALRVYSEPGVGTTFKLYFRARHAPKEAGPATDKPALSAAPTGRIRILLAEDELEVQHIIATTLRRAGYEVHATNSGDEAKTAFSADQSYDLLLTDIVMPGTLQGTGLAKELRAMRPDMPVVFMSGYASEATVHGNGLRPEDIRLMKPVRKANLLEAIQRALLIARNGGGA